MRYFTCVITVIGCTASEPVESIRHYSRVVLHPPTEVRYEPASSTKVIERMLEPSSQNSPPVQVSGSSTDCTGLVAGPDPMVPSSKAPGKFGVGQMLGTEFVPLLYFSTAKGAKNCSGGMEVRKWNGNGWIKI
jgi:hypothetical protein